MFHAAGVSFLPDGRACKLVMNRKSAMPPPPAHGVRLDWRALPPRVRTAVEQWAGCAVVHVASQPTGFSPGVAARLRMADGRQVFVKAVGPSPNPVAPSIHRREAQIVAALPAIAPVPRLLWSYDEGEGGWVVLVFEDVDGRPPAQPWDLEELERVIDALAAMAEALTPSPVPNSVVGSARDEFGGRFRGWQPIREARSSQFAHLDAWSARHLAALTDLEAEAAEAVAGETLLHFDVRADNVLLTSDRVWFVDWPLACVGAAWVDAVFFAPSVTMQGGPPPEEVIARHPACRSADPAAITAGVAAVAGFFTHRALQPPPPGLPTVRAFQAAQAIVARQWVAQRTGWK
jgi:aminoglycoside phosphotransferase (APT) family kinase protein